MIILEIMIWTRKKYLHQQRCKFLLLERRNKIMSLIEGLKNNLESDDLKAFMEAMTEIEDLDEDNDIEIDDDEDFDDIEDDEEGEDPDLGEDKDDLDFDFESSIPSIELDEPANESVADILNSLDPIINDDTIDDEDL